MDKIINNIAEFLQLLEGVSKSGESYKALCPAHDDKNPSLSVKQANGRILLHCFAGCKQENVIKAMGLTRKNLYIRSVGYSVTPLPVHNQNTVTTPELHTVNGVTLEALSQKKRLPIDYLKSLWLKDCQYHDRPAITFPYLDEVGNRAAVRYRLTLTAGDNGQRFAWQKGEHVLLYGLDRLQKIRDLGWVLLVEGESNCWTLWFHNLPALGIPGKSNWKTEWAPFLTGLKVYLWQDPGAEDLSSRLAEDISNLLVIPAPDGVKDISEAHIQGKDVPHYLEELKTKSLTAQEIKADQVDKHLRELYKNARDVIETEDPLEVVKDAIRNLGYGGDLKPALVTYLAATSRLLLMRRGSMPVHLLLTGPSSAGKSYTLSVVKTLLPSEAFHEIDAGSPRVLIYDKAPLKHRILIFAEVDSLPQGEDNPAASAIRNLLQDHYLHYSVVVQHPKTGSPEVLEINKVGPTVLITTSTRELPEQLATRVFTQEMRTIRSK